MGTSSSEPALPLLMHKLERAGVSEASVGLILPMGYSFNLSGINIYMTLAALFIAQAMDISLTIEQQLSILMEEMTLSLKLDPHTLEVKK